MSFAGRPVFAHDNPTPRAPWLVDVAKAAAVAAAAALGAEVVKAAAEWAKGKRAAPVPPSEAP